MSNIGCYFSSYQILKQDDESVHIGFGNNSVVLTNEPFRLDFLVNKEVVVSVNARGLMNFEEYREKRYLVYLFKVHKNQFYIVSFINITFSSFHDLKFQKIVLFFICCPVSCSFEQALQHILDTLFSNPDSKPVVQLMRNYLTFGFRKVPVKVDEGEGHPPGENEEEKPEKEAEEVCS